MEHWNPKILSTKILSERERLYAAELGFSLQCEAFIETQNAENLDEAVQLLNAKQYDAWVITSINAAEYIKRLLEKKNASGARLICISQKVAQAFKSSAVTIERAARANAQSVAELIVADGNIHSCLYFRGDKSLDVIDKHLDKYGISLDSIISYKTVLLKKKLTHSYDAYCFFSPSAVRAFVNSGNRLNETPIFAIGHTTAETIRVLTRKEVIVAPNPSARSLIETIKQYFDERKKQNLL